MCFNGERIRPKRRTIAHIRDGIKTLRSHARARDINAILGHKLFIARQIDGGNGVLRAESAPTPRRAQNAERTRQQMPRPAHSSLADQTSDVAARNPLAAQLLFRVDFHFKSHLLPQFRQQIHIARSLVSEAEVVAFMHFARMQFLLQNALDKLARRHQRKIAPKGQHQHRIDARRFEQAQFFRRLE